MTFCGFGKCCSVVLSPERRPRTPLAKSRGFQKNKPEGRAGRAYAASFSRLLAYATAPFEPDNKSTRVGGAARASRGSGAARRSTAARRAAASSPSARTSNAARLRKLAASARTALSKACTENVGAPTSCAAPPRNTSARPARPVCAEYLRVRGSRLTAEAGARGSPPRHIHVAATASPRLFSAAYGGHGVAARRRMNRLELTSPETSTPRRVRVRLRGGLAERLVDGPCREARRVAREVLREVA